jgi:hypothetical protein
MLTLLSVTGNILGITPMPTMVPNNQLMTSMATESQNFNDILAIDQGIQVILGLTSDIFGPFSEFLKYSSK